MGTLKNIPTGTANPDPAVVGQLVFRTDTGLFYLYDGTNWLQIGICDSLSNMSLPGRVLKE